MTFFEAIELVENALIKLNIFENGEPLLAMEVSGMVQLAIGERWDQCILDLKNGKISIDQYAHQMIHMIDQYSRIQYALKVDQRLAKLRLDQIELDIIKKCP